MRVEWADIVSAARETSEALNGQEWVGAGIKARVLLADLADEVERLNRVVNDLLADQRFALHELLPERERLKDEVGRLRAAVAELAGVCRGVVARLELWSDREADEDRVYRGVVMQALANQLEAALAAAEPRPAGETERSE